MDREFKLTLALLSFLLLASGLLLINYIPIHFFSFQFQKGFLPFALLLSSYILFSSKTIVTQISIWIKTGHWKKYSYSFYGLALYSIIGLFWSNFNPFLFFKLAFWLVLPVWILTHNGSSIGVKELLSILILWVPIELNSFSGFDIILKENISIPAIPFVASGLGLYLFTVLRPTHNVGFSFLLSWKDLGAAFFIFLSLSFLLVPLGLFLGFIHFTQGQVSSTEFLKLILGIYFLVALPEELLFRGIIQNLLSKFFEEKHIQKARFIALFTASIIFGLSHLNNYSPPNWNYVLMATLAGIFYGLTYIKTSKCAVSALVHCGVNLFWAIFFGATGG